MNNIKSAREVHKDRMLLWEATLGRQVKYINPETGYFDEKYIEFRKCPVCKSETFEKLLDKAGGTYVKCTECSMVFTNPTFKDTYLNEHYSGNHDLQSQIVENDSDFYRSIYQKGIDLIASVNPSKTGNILDFGCSTGFFLDVAKSNGWNQTNGLELNKAEFKVAKSKGHMMYNELIEKTDFGKKFKVITLWDVFEHLKDGAKFLQIFNDLIDDDGMIFLQIPNVMGLAPRIMHENCNMFDGLEHVNLYGPDTLSKLAVSSGFRVAKMQTVISEINVLNNYLHFENSYAGKMPSTQNLLNILDEKAIHEKLLGYKIQVVLMKDK